MAIEAKHTNIKDLIMGDLNQFHIPIYQRAYTWKVEQVEKLMEDIIEFGEEYKENPRADYYIGNIIVKNQTRAFMVERVVIDGQQRITTAILMLCSIRDICLNKVKSEDAKKLAKRISKYLFEEEGEEIKIKLNNMEHQNTLKILLTGDISTISSVDKETRYWKNYQYIYKKLDAMDEESFQKFYDILDRVKLVTIFLDDDQDENSVFESINSLGKPLSGSDLIKNFLFTFKNYKCSHTEEKRLTDLYTKNFEKLFLGDKVEKDLENFFREYIALKTQEKVNNDPKIIYYSFKKMVGDIEGFEQCKNLINDLIKWATIYQILRIGSHKDIDNNHLEYLRSSFLTYAVLLMDIVDKSSRVENGELIVEEKNRLNEALKKVVVYDVCRFLGDYPAKEITRFIPTIPKKLEKISEEYYLDYASAFESLVTATLEGYKQPKVNFLRHRIIDTNVYKEKQIKKFLVLLENIGKKEIISFERDLKGCEIEHIMPQTLPNKGWEGISESNHEKYLHTLGNLTITFDNQSLSNKSFAEKKKILAEKSRINLNQRLLKNENFDEQTIKTRTIELFDMFVDSYGLKYVNEIETQQEVFIYIIYKNITAKAIIEQNRTIVKKGSQAIFSDQDSLRNLKNIKIDLINKKILVQENDILVFTTDYEFSSPSSAAGIIVGSSVNGNEAWKYRTKWKLDYSLNDIKKSMKVDSVDTDTLIKFEDSFFLL